MPKQHKSHLPNIQRSYNYKLSILQRYVIEIKMKYVICIFFIKTSDLCMLQKSVDSFFLPFLSCRVCNTKQCHSDNAAFVNRSNDNKRPTLPPFITPNNCKQLNYLKDGPLLRYYAIYRLIFQYPTIIII